MEPEIQKKLYGHHLLLYDGVCGLCNGLTKFVLPRDKRDIFRFASLQSQFAQDVLKRYGRDASDLDTFYAVSNYGLPEEAIKERADAALFVLDQLGGIYSLSRIYRLLPLSLLNRVYDLVAKNRYKMFGKYETCLLPNATYANKFIDV
jgi:predicted DCC family thiol-disulfide oxidoreductase YuxK